MKLSQVQETFVLMLGIDRLKVETMRQIASQFETMSIMNAEFGVAAKTFRQSADDVEAINTTMKESVMTFDHDGKIATFLEEHILNPIWMEKVK